jgi:acyl-CoA synthetase (AMP-forming)/AMP-acid ligase II
LSVAFDASCEEMWLAWRNSACLVPAPRSLVRSGVDLGRWLVDQGITVVSTVPTLAALWPQDSLDGVRLLIFGGEACPPELAERLVDEGREVWNTYGPTEATVVACAAPLAKSVGAGSDCLWTAVGTGLSSTRVGAGVARRDRRTDHRRRAGQVPRPDWRRRRARAHADAWLGTGLPQGPRQSVQTVGSSSAAPTSG